ncbi:MAG: transposase [Methyloprofundus sp.]|nr:transposase [Methyloprofundus sp.]
MHQDDLISGEFYHLFNRANSQTDQLFYQARNYHYFLQQWTHYLNDIFEVWAYCLIPNHYHFLVKLKSCSYKLAIEASRKFTISYTQAINKQQSRRGSLFQEHPKRIHIESESHLLGLIHYIHHNPVHHGLTQKIEEWRFNSYAAILNPVKSKVEREQVLALFSGAERFVAFHQQMNDYRRVKGCIAE